MARGQSSAALAERLVLSEATVKTHVARVLDTLGLRDRFRPRPGARERRRHARRVSPVGRWHAVGIGAQALNA